MFALLLLLLPVCVFLEGGSELERGGNGNGGFAFRCSHQAAIFSSKKRGLK